MNIYKANLNYLALKNTDNTLEQHLGAILNNENTTKKTTKSQVYKW